LRQRSFRKETKTQVAVLLSGKSDVRFCGHKPVLVSRKIKKQTAKVFLVLSGVPFGRPLNQSRFFKTEKEALGFAAYLKGRYKNRV
jgi:hypothetical protein